MVMKRWETHISPDHGHLARKKFFVISTLAGKALVILLKLPEFHPLPHDISTSSWCKVVICLALIWRVWFLRVLSSSHTTLSWTWCVLHFIVNWLCAMLDTLDTSHFVMPRSRNSATVYIFWQCNLLSSHSQSIVARVHARYRFLWCRIRETELGSGKVQSNRHSTPSIARAWYPKC